MHVFAALAEFIRELIIENTRDGVAAAKARGQQFGRPKVMTDEQISQAIARPTEGQRESHRHASARLPLDSLHPRPQLAAIRATAKKDAAAALSAQRPPVGRDAEPWWQLSDFTRQDGRREG